MIGRAAEAQGDVDLEDLPPCSENPTCEAPYNAQKPPDSYGLCYTQNWMESTQICVGIEIPNQVEDDEDEPWRDPDVADVIELDFVEWIKYDGEIPENADGGKGWTTY